MCVESPTGPVTMIVGPYKDVDDAIDEFEELGLI